LTVDTFVVLTSADALPAEDEAPLQTGDYEQFSADHLKRFCPAEQPGKQQEKERIVYGRRKDR